MEKRTPLSRTPSRPTYSSRPADWIEYGDAVAAENDRLRAENERMFVLIRDILVEELNGVLCTPPYKIHETDAFGPDSFPDYDAPVQRNYCGSCRSIWRRIRDIVREHDRASNSEETHV